MLAFGDGDVVEEDGDGDSFANEERSRLDRLIILVRRFQHETKDTHLLVKTLAIRPHRLQIALTRQRLPLPQSPTRHIHQPLDPTFFPILRPLVHPQSPQSRRTRQPAIRVQQHDDFGAVVYEAGNYVTNSGDVFVKGCQTWRRADGRERDDGRCEIGVLEGGCEGLVVGGCLAGGGDDDDGGEGHCGSG